MPATWTYRLRLSDVFHNDAMSLVEKRDAIVKRIRASRFWTEDDADLVDIVEELSDVTDVNDFDAVWAAFYDWANAERVWVETR